MIEKSVFIAYRRETRPLVEKMVDFFKENGIDAFFDRHIRAPEDWVARINREIASRERFLLILTFKTFNSAEYAEYKRNQQGQSDFKDPIMRELEYAKEEIANEIFVVVVDGAEVAQEWCDEFSIFDELKRKQEFDFVSYEFKDSMTRLLADLYPDLVGQSVDVLDQPQGEASAIADTGNKLPDMDLSAVEPETRTCSDQLIFLIIICGMFILGFIYILFQVI